MPLSCYVAVPWQFHESPREPTLVLWRSTKAHGIAMADIGRSLKTQGKSTTSRWQGDGMNDHDGSSWQECNDDPATAVQWQRYKKSVVVHPCGTPRRRDDACYGYCDGRAMAVAMGFRRTTTVVSHGSVAL